MSSGRRLGRAREASGSPPPGYRRGGARRAVIGLLGEQRCALSALEIGARARARGPRGVAGERLQDPRGARAGCSWSRASRSGRHRPLRAVRHAQRHHHHLVCDRCGRLIPFADEGLERELSTGVSEDVALAVAEHEIILHGACRDCAA